jgi:hypothetical protein
MYTSMDNDKALLLARWVRPGVDAGSGKGAGATSIDGEGVLKVGDLTQV